MLRSQELVNLPIKVSFNHRLILIFFVITRLIAIFLSFPCISDVSFYLKIFTNLNSGLTPYSEFGFEYPPLALIPIYLPRFLIEKNPSFDLYYCSFSALMFAVDFYCLKLCQNYCRDQLKLSQKEINYMSLLYVFFGLLMFRVLYHRLDLVVALFFTISLRIFHSEKSQTKFPIMGIALLGFFYKIVPIMNLPVALILKAFQVPRNMPKTIKEIALNSAILFGVIIVIITLLEIGSKHRFIANMFNHKERGIQIESIYGSFFLFKDLLLDNVTKINSSFGSWNIAANYFWEFFAKIFGNVILIGFYLALFCALFRKRLLSEEIFLDATLLTILLFLTFQRVLSPQFFIWLIPIAAIWLARNRSIIFMTIFSFLFFATFVIFSIDYKALLNQEPILTTILFLRNMSLLTVTCLLTIRFFKQFKND